MALTAAALADIERLGVELREGAPLTVCDYDADEDGSPAWIVAEGVVHYDAAPSRPYLTASDAVTVCEIAPLVPVTTRVTFPNAVEDVVCTVSVELPAPVTEVGLKRAVARGRAS